MGLNWNPVPSGQSPNGVLPYPGMCEASVEGALGTTGIYATATDAANAAIGAGFVQNGNSPAGIWTVVFWPQGGSNYPGGHIAFWRADDTGNGGTLRSSWYDSYDVPYGVWEEKQFGSIDEMGTSVAGIFNAVYGGYGEFSFAGWSLNGPTNSDTGQWSLVDDNQPAPAGTGEHGGNDKIPDKPNESQSYEKSKTADCRLMIAVQIALQDKWLH